MTTDQDWADKAARQWLDPNGDMAADAVVPGLIESLAAIIRSSAPDAPLRGCLENIASCENDSVGREKMGIEYWYWKMIKDARAALSETKAVCAHKYTPYDNTWATGCGKVIDDNDSDAEWGFCPYCGLPISVKEK